MAFTPREQSKIYEDLRDRLKEKIAGLSNFSETSFNWVWTQGFSSEFREQELDKTATYLSGLIEYSGGPVTEEDLEDLGISDVADVDELNERLNDSDLDELVKIVGVDRDPGTKATGVVEFETQSSPTTIPIGTSVGTRPDERGNFLEFFVLSDEGTLDESDTAPSNGSGDTTITANVQAAEVGNEYNVGSATSTSGITYLPDPPTGVQSVTNPDATTGGEDEESNDELRERAQRAIFESSGGGTVEGVRGFIANNVDDVEEVQVIEFFDGDNWHGDYPHAHVIVSGGIESEILDAIDSSRPVAVQHAFVRPQSFLVRVDVSVEGTDVEKQKVRDQISSYIDSLGLGDELVDVKVIQRIMNADSNIEDIASLDLYIQEEDIFFDSQTNVYELSHGDAMQDDGITLVEGTLNGTSGHEFVEDTDYQEWNTTSGDTSTPHDAIDWSLAGDEPDTLTGETETLTYDADDTDYLVDDAMITNGVTDITDASGDTYTEGTDFEETDIRADGNVNGITFDINDDGTADAATPDDNEEFTVTYDAGTKFFTTYLIQEQTDINFENDELPITGDINVTVV